MLKFGLAAVYCLVTLLLNYFRAKDRLFYLQAQGNNLLNPRAHFQHKLWKALCWVSRAGPRSLPVRAESWEQHWQSNMWAVQRWTWSHVSLPPAGGCHRSCAGCSGLSLTKDPPFCHCFAALVVRFLTKRFIGDYEANTGEFCSPQQHCREWERNPVCFVTGARYRGAKWC